jgi:hypothetical protein
MSTDRDVTTRIVRSWLHEDAHEDADRILNLVLDQIDTTPQRRATWLARRFPLMNNNVVRVALAAAALVAAVIIGAKLLPGPDVGPSPSIEPSPSVQLLDALPEGDLFPGTYGLDSNFLVPLTLTLPPGFNHGRGGPELVGIHTPSGHGLEFQIVSNVYPDPCHRTAGGPDPAVGPTVDDLVTAMTNMAGFHVGPAVDVTVGGLPAKVIELTNSIDYSTCDQQDVRTVVFGLPGSVRGNGEGSSVGGDEHQRIYILDVRGTRLTIMTYWFPSGNDATDARYVADLQSIVDSITFP